MKHFIHIIVASITMMLFIACGGSANSATPRGQAIDHIIDYAESQGSGSITTPTLQDYIDAGISGVTEKNLAEINEIVENLTKDEVDTPEEIQAIVNELNINIAPIAKLSVSSEDVFVGEVVKFSSKGTDLDGNITKIVWSIGTKIYSNSPIFNHIFTQSGNYRVKLLVTDNDGDSSSISIIITVKEVKVVKVGPTAKISVSSVNVDTTETIKFESKSLDGDSNITDILWTIDGRVRSTISVFYNVFGQAGEYKIELLVTDDNGASDSTFTIITVTKAPVNPNFTGGNFKGKTYELVTSPRTGKVWLDRNLGASQVCTSFNDTDCYGDYYQWGRNTDGHEKLGAGEINTQPTSFTNLGSNFIRSYNQYSWDWAFNIDPTREIRDVNWDICPVGFIIADFSEFRDEFDAYSINNRQDAFESFLALPSAGMRPSYSVDVIDDGFLGSYWTDDTPTINAGQTYLTFSESDWAGSDGGEAAAGRTIRCIKR